MPATKFTITGSGTQVAGQSQVITITADDVGYTGDHTLTFSGANPSLTTRPLGSPTTRDKTSVDIAFGSSCILTFAAGVATSRMFLYKVETAIIACTDGTISATGAQRLTVAVSAPTPANMPIVISAVMEMQYVAGGTAPSTLAIYPKAIMWDNPTTAGHKVIIKQSSTGSVLFTATARAQFDTQYVRLNKDTRGGVKWQDFIVTQIDSGTLYIWY